MYIDFPLNVVVSLLKTKFSGDLVDFEAFDYKLLLSSSANLSA